MRAELLLLMLLACTSYSYAQQINDTTAVKLQEVQVHAYEQDEAPVNIPASINTISTTQLNRFGNTGLLPAINATPGVRMEERSPGSYRLSIRGSSLRAPFGVRNVKVYYNDIPITDPGGNTYFNQLGFYNVQSLEIIKGPGGSVYGAGTGGVMLINSIGNNWQPGITIGYAAGSYGMSNLNAELRFGKDGISNTVRYQRLTSDGYREHSNMRRDVASWDAKMKWSDKNTFTANFLYSDLYYQTPGALTLAEYQADPRSARPPAGNFRGAITANATIYQKTFLAGFTNKHQLSKHLYNSTTLYGMYSQLRNPAIQNYGSNTEPHMGGRTVFKYDLSIGTSTLGLTAGAELQKGFASFKTYKNKGGKPDTLLLNDEVNTDMSFGFVQASLVFKKWIVTTGLSINKQNILFARLSSYPYTEYKKEFDNEAAPRIALLYKAGSNWSLYGNMARGFSPPTTAELLPTGNDLNPSLVAEYGWNYEAGSKGSLLKNKLHYNVSAFLFNLGNAIVVRRDAGGGNYFVNAGATEQAGIEAYLNYQIIDSKENFISGTSVLASYSYYHFRYKTFVQGEDDYSGNELPAVAPHTLTAGLDVSAHSGIYANITCSYTDAIPLNDANTAYGDAYFLAGARVGYKVSVRSKYSIDLYAGADNLLDKKYSLGNDINGFSGRYYNVAPGRNYFAGIILGYQ